MTTADDELLARADRLNERHDGHANDETVELSGYELNRILIALGDLASALRRKSETEVKFRGALTELAVKLTTTEHELAEGRQREERLVARIRELAVKLTTTEHELAEARDEVDRWKGDAKQYAQKAERWHEKAEQLERERDEARDHCPHVVTSDGGTSFCGLAERSHGEVLARETTRAFENPADSHLSFVLTEPPLDLPPGTDVLVVRADQEATQ